MQMKHTQGEWRISLTKRNSLGVPQKTIYTDSPIENQQRIVANVFGGTTKSVQEAEANAKLIAASKDLLEAVSVLPDGTSYAHVQDVPTMIEKAANLLEIKAVNDGNPDAHKHIINALLLIAQNQRKAIKKATE